MRVRLLAILRLALPVFLASTVTHAQMIGLAALLNPEGSRLFPQPIIAPRHPGKPDPRWKNFHWKFTDREVDGTPYRLFFYDGEDWTAKFAMPRIDDQVRWLTREFNFKLPKRFSYLLFTSLREFRQANVFFISEGVQGITSTTEATMAIPYWGNAAAFDHVSKHEMVHQFQVQKMNAGENTVSAAAVQVPLWFIEGMAEYYSLGGLDAETRMYLRDLSLNPDPKRKYEAGKFFEEGPLDFIHTYKLGQAKIAFLETEFGKGTTQKILDAISRGGKDQPDTFVQAVAKELKLPDDGKGGAEQTIEAGWNAYFQRTVRQEVNALSQTIEDSSIIAEVGDTIDAFDLSRNGKILATREVDPLTGIASIRVFNRENLKESETAATDGRPGYLSLYFMQNPTLAVSDRLVAYAVETTTGPILEIRWITVGKDGTIRLSEPLRARTDRLDLVQINAVAIGPDSRSLTFVGLSPAGWSTIYVTDSLQEAFQRDPERSSEKDVERTWRKLVSTPYRWRTLSWEESGLFASSDRTNNYKQALYKIDVKTGEVHQLASPSADQLAPDASQPRTIVFQSWESGSSQIHRLSLEDRSNTRLTEVKTGLLTPRWRNNELYALVFKSGRFRLVRLPPEKLLPNPASAAPGSPQDFPAAWEPLLAEIGAADVRSYRAFMTSGVRVDGLYGYFASGSAGGLAASVSDLMRNYSLSGEISLLGSSRFTNTYLFLTSAAGRTTWTMGAYGIFQPRLDNVFSEGQTIRTYLHREYGMLGALQYPLTAFSFLDAELRVASVNRTDYSDPALDSAWNARNPGREFLLSPIIRLGYDDIIYEAFSGPLKGFGLLAESDTSVFPHRGVTAERVRLDAARYFQIAGRMVLAFNAMAGGSWGGDFKNPFLVSSDDILRGYAFLDSRLYGNYVLATKAELRFPIGTFFGFPPLRGLAAYDIGSIFREKHTLGSQVSSSYTGGISLNLPPLSINFMLSYPIRLAPGPRESPIVHFTLRYLYL